MNFLCVGEHLLRGIKESDYKVWIGPQIECNITSITTNFIACLLPDRLVNNAPDTLASSSGGVVTGATSLLQSETGRFRRLVDSPQDIVSYEVKIQIGAYFTRTIGFLKYEKELVKSPSNAKMYDMFEIKFSIAAACVLSFFLFTTMISCFVILKRRQNKQIRQLKRMQTEFENLEMRVARECKEAFTELQMDIGELANTLNQTGAPFNDYQTYCMKVFLL